MRSFLFLAILLDYLMMKSGGLVGKYLCKKSKIPYSIWVIGRLLGQMGSDYVLPVFMG